MTSPARPRVALVVHDLDPNLGQGRYALELLRRLHPCFEFTVLANRCRAELPAEVVWRRVPAWRGNALGTITTFILPAERAVRRGGFDLVHAQGLTGWSADVSTAHICGAARHARQPPARWGGRLFAAVVIPLERAFYRRRRLRHVIAISRVVAGELREHYGWRGPLSVIHHGTDVAVFRPPAGAAEKDAARRRFGLPAEGWNWLFMGEAAKGLREAVALLPAFPAARLLVVSRSRLDAFRAQAARLGVAERVVFHGPHEQPQEAHRAADVFVYPSAYDTFGLVVTEAMASGLPVLAGRGIGAAELIEDRRNGLLGDPADAAQLRAQLEWLAAAPARAAALGQAARDTITRGTWDACADATAGVYERVLAERRPAA
jgi:glycosyltransferase involved in cell wall biosynthesis